MGKLRRIGIDGPPEDEPKSTVVNFPGTTPKKKKGNKGEMTQAKYLPEEADTELFKVVALGSASTAKMPVTRFIRAMIEADGFLARAASKLGIHYSTLKKYMKENPKLKTLAEDIQEMLLDLAESQLKKSIKSGNLGAIQYYLNCKGRHRGWISDPKQIPTTEKTPVFVFKKAEAKKVG